ncbi:hypothetical protein L6452_39488 [Arctium lappa]|uniref:Uncharacterized protein n=1 Tax=Arctium lappa TaxID=4217 RepID=A0ACB8XTB6_ARCLA|nr:hypothetical protein L6452_39488 [Arctium lappa]
MGWGGRTGMGGIVVLMMSGEEALWIEVDQQYLMCRVVVVDSHTIVDTGRNSEGAFYEDVASASALSVAIRQHRKVAARILWLKNGLFIVAGESGVVMVMVMVMVMAGAEPGSGGLDTVDKYTTPCADCTTREAIQLNPGMRLIYSWKPSKCFIYCNSS